MFILSEEESSWPKCLVYLKHNLAPKTLKKNTKVYGAFIKACGNEKLAIKALTYGEYPQVSIPRDNKLISLLDPGDPKHKSIIKICGYNQRTILGQDANTIYVAGIRATPLENSLNSGDIANNKRRFECTVLHELVHYVRRKAELSDIDWDFKQHPLEPGEQFEHWAYGKRTCDADELADAASSVF